MPKFSLIIPVYNVAEYIRECLDSIMNQDFYDWEAILINDGSTDISGDICDEYSHKDSRFKVFHKSNGGVSTARNVGLENAKGQWIWFVDSDDYIVPGSFNILNKAIVDCNSDTIFFGIIRKRGDILKESKNNFIKNYSKEKFLNQVFCFLNQSILFSRAIIESENLRFSPGVRMAEDLEFQYKYLCHIDKPLMIPNNLYVYNLREGSAMRNSKANYNNVVDCFKVCENLLTHVSENTIAPTFWFGKRVRLLLKSCLQSAARLPKKDRSWIQCRYRKIVNNYVDRGYKIILDKRLKIAYLNLPLYFFFLKRYYKINNIR